MDKKEFSALMGKRLKSLRQNRGWSQAQLSQKLKVHQKQISSYERGVHAPAADILARIAKLFNSSLDYIAFGDQEDTNNLQLADRDLMQKIKEIDKLSEKDKTIIKGVLDTFIVKNQIQRLTT